MRISNFTHQDIDRFLSLSEAEGWICDRWEFEFLLQRFPRGCFTVRVDGVPVAFISSIKYESSGWIGNLLVEKEYRGQGFGALLMKASIDELQSAGAKTVWLTASQAGRPIYERLGFLEVDVIRRWVGRGAEGGARMAQPGDLALLDALDRSGWGDSRTAILGETLARGTVFSGRNGFAILQDSVGGMQVGPWGGSDREEAAELLDMALAAAGPQRKVFLDAPVRNVQAAVILYSRGFGVAGSSTLMYLGCSPEYVPEKIYALASMGSMG